MAGVVSIGTTVIYEVKPGDVLDIGGVKITEKDGKGTVEYEAEVPVEPTILDTDQHVKVPTEGTYFVPKGVTVTFGASPLGLVSTCLDDGKTYQFLGVDDGDN